MPDTYSCEVCGKPTSRRGRKGNDYAWLCPEHMPRQCAEYVGRGRMGVGSCDRPATRERNGKWYCATHDPIAVAERKKKQDAKWKAESDARTERWDTESRHKRIGELMEQLAVTGGVVMFHGDGSIGAQAGNALVSTGTVLIDVLESALANEGKNV